MVSDSLAHEYDCELGVNSRINRKENAQSHTNFRWICSFSVGMVYFAVLFYLLLLDVAKSDKYNGANPFTKGGGSLGDCNSDCFNNQH